MDILKEIEHLKNRIAELEKVVFKTEAKVESPITNSNRDKTKYLFNGKVLAKNRLVLSVIQNYVKQNSPTFEELSKVFDKSLQGSLNVVEILQNASKISDCKKRYFMKPDDILQLGDTQVVVCTQWGIFNIVKFIKLAQNLGYDIIEIKV